MGTLIQFANKMNRLGIRVKDRADQITRGAAGVFLESVTADTPYLTGRAISNWLVGSGAPRTAIVPPAVFKGGKGANVAATVAAGKARIAGYKHGNDIYVVNNLPYINLLNTGSSTQHPGAFVQVGMQRALAYVQRQKLLDGN